MTGGVKVTLEHALFLQEQGHEVVCVRPASPRLGWKQKLKSLLPGHQPLPGHVGGGHSWIDQLTIIEGSTPGIIHPHEIPHGDIILSTWWETVLWSAELPSMAGRQVHFVQDHEVFPYLPRDRVEKAYRAPGYKIAVSLWLHELLRHEYKTQNLFLVENGVDLSRFVPGSAMGRTIDCGFVWSSAPRKNSPMAIDALHRVRAKRPSLRAVVFGSEPCPSMLQGLDWVTYHERPAQDLIPQLYSQCRSWLFPSISEGFGLPLLEALACGTPVIATRAGAAPQLIDDGNGMLIDCDAAGMASALLHLLEEPGDTWAARSLHARSRAEQYSRSKSSERFEVALKAIHAEKL